MDTLEYITTLEDARRWAQNHPGETYTGEFRERVLAAFDALWASRPTEEHFCKLMGGVLLLPEMLYRLASRPRA